MIKKLAFYLLLCLFAVSVFSEPLPTYTYSPLLLSVIVNEYSTGETQLLLEDNLKNLYASKETLASWGLIPPQNNPVNFRNIQYFNLDWYKGYTFNINSEQLLVKLDFPAKYFKPSSKNIQNYQFYLPDKAAYGAFLNYNLFSTGPVSLQSSDQETTNSNALFSPTFFGPYGNVTIVPVK